MNNECQIFTHVLDITLQLANVMTTLGDVARETIAVITFPPA